MRRFRTTPFIRLFVMPLGTMDWSWNKTSAIFLMTQSYTPTRSSNLINKPWQAARLIVMLKSITSFPYLTWTPAVITPARIFSFKLLEIEERPAEIWRSGIRTKFPWMTTLLRKNNQEAFAAHHLLSLLRKEEMWGFSVSPSMGSSGVLKR